jgi:hypothetical protein
LGRLLKYAVLSAFLVFVTPRLTTWIPLTFPFAHPEQDACTFGPVTNPEYREMLAKARSIQRWTWLGSKPEDQLLKQFSEVSGNNPSPYVKIAAMHAVLRALGADFRNIGRFSDGMFDQVSKKGGTIQYNYALPVPRIGALSGWPGDAWFIGGLKYEKWSNSSRCTFAQGHQEAKDSSIRRLWSTVARWRSATAL